MGALSESSSQKDGTATNMVMQLFWDVNKRK